MAGQHDKTRSQQLGEAGVAYRQRLIDKGIEAVGKQASDAVKLTPEQELQRWLLPTSDAAKLALQRGGTMDDAIMANQMSANHAKAQQQQIVAQLQQQGASAADIAKALQQAQLSDDQIFQAHRKYAYQLGKSNSFGKPSKEVEYHQHMSEKAAEQRAQRPSIQTVEQGV